MVEEKERWREEKEKKQNEEKIETVRSFLFGAMVLERILGMYVGCYQDEVWDVWDYPDYLIIFSLEWDGSGAAVGQYQEYQ